MPPTSDVEFLRATLRHAIIRAKFSSDTHGAYKFLIAVALTNCMILDAYIQSYPNVLKLRPRKKEQFNLLDPHIWYTIQRLYVTQFATIRQTDWFKSLLRHATTNDLDCIHAFATGASGVHAYLVRSLQTSLLTCAYERDQAHKSVSPVIPAWFRASADWSTLVQDNWHCEIRAANAAFLTQQDAVMTDIVHPQSQSQQTSSPLASPTFVTYEGDPKRLKDPRYERDELLRRIVDGTMSGWETHASGQDLRDIYYLMRGRPERVGAKTTPGYTNKADLLAAILAMKNVTPSVVPPIV